jgi:hypothetical protein
VKHCGMIVVLAGLISTLVLVSLARGGQEPAPPDSLEAWLPDTVAGYVKLNQAGDRLKEFLGSGLRKRIESMPAGQAAMATDGWREFTKMLDEFRTSTGKEPQAVFADLFGREVVLGFRKGEFANDTIIITRTAGKAELDAGLDAIRKAFQAKFGMPLEGYKTSYGDTLVETVGEASFTAIGPVLAIASPSSLLEKVIDLASGKSKASVKASADFAKAPSAAKGDLAFFAGRPKMLPDFNVPAKLDNALASLVAGGILASLGGSEVFSMALRPAGDALELEVSSVGGGEKIAPFFPAASDDAVAGRLGGAGVVALAQLRRDVKAWWDKRNDLLTEGQAAGMLQANTFLSAIFGGKSFQDEILPKIGSTITLVAKNVSFAAGEKPAPSLPGIAILFPMKGAKESREDLVSAFRTVMGFVNAGLAGKDPNGGAAFQLKTEMVGDVEVQLAASNLPMAVRKTVVGNFVPSLAVVGSQVVISTNLDLTKSIIAALGSGKAGGASAAAGCDTLVLESAPLGSLLDENREFLIADNMQKKGSTREQAEKDVKTFLDILGLVKDLKVSSKKDGDAVKTALRLRAN